MGTESAFIYPAQAETRRIFMSRDVRCLLIRHLSCQVARRKWASSDAMMSCSRMGFSTKPIGCA